MSEQMAELHGLRDALRAISGREPAPTDVQRLIALARVLGMRKDDGMLPILAVLDTYHGIFSRLPAEMQVSAKAAADGAAEQAKARINEAVAHLVPSVEVAVSRAAEATIKRVQVGRSFWSVCTTIILLAVLFGFGELVGLQQGTAVHAHVSWAALGAAIGWRAALAAAVVGLFMLAIHEGGLDNGADRNSVIRTYTLLSVGLVGLAALILRVLGVA